MNNKGFTLIELLAVILILGIIALIAIPTVSSVVEQSRKGAFENTVSQLVKSIEQDCMEREVSGKDKILEYTINNGIFDNEIAIKGDIPDEGIFIIKDGTCEVVKYDVSNGTYASIMSEDKEVETIKSNVTKKYDDGTVVYYNPESNTKCSSSDYEKNLSNHSSKGIPTLLKSGCMKWYTFLDDGSNKVNMLLDHSTTGIVAWNSTGDNNEMKEVKEALECDTKTWYTYLNSRLISVLEVVDIVKNTKFNINDTNLWNNTIKFDADASETNVNKYAWLFDHLYTTTTVGFGNYDDSTGYSYYLDGVAKKNAQHGYWTSSKAASGDYVWIVDKRGGLYINHANYDGTNIYNGVRPVISVYKSVID